MIFNTQYNQESFIELLGNFLPDDFQLGQEDILINSERYKEIKIAKVLGFCKSLDLHVLEMSHSQEKDPRVSIATDAFKIIADHWIHRAIIIFKNNDSDNYRLSFLTITLDVNDKNKVIKKYSNARRFSFYLGINSKIKTPEQQLIKKGKIKDYDDLLARFSVEVVNKQFYLEVAKCFDELVSTEDANLILPEVVEGDINLRKSFAIRLIGRLMFCWFLKHKKSDNGQLIPDELLSSKVVKDNYYHNILEPLFFGVLNTGIEVRDIRNDFFDKVPYLNGGLFSPQNDDYYELDRSLFVSKYKDTLVINDSWFKYFLELLETYNFTIDENTVFDQELSVDPEMLGRIFENLLAEINPETGSSERKRTGSFYTPRQIVEYMVDRSLIEYLITKTNIEEAKITALVSYDLTDDLEYPLNNNEKLEIIDAIERLKILDPACGSGAFPIGALQKIVYILQQIDPNCQLWLNKKLENIPVLFRQKIIQEVESAPFDYTRKLNIIKNSIFGVDIQPVAVDVSRLRCFLTLVVESKIDDSKPNRGIEPLPNLDFKFVCANTLIGLPKIQHSGLFDDHSGILELSKLMADYFSCNSGQKNEIKIKFTNTQKDILEKTLSAFGKNVGDLTIKLVTWNPFGNESNSWFDSEWMFGIQEKFDVVIANPPYIDSETMVKEQPDTRNLYAKSYATAKGNWDLYIPFLELGYNLLSETGIASYITPNKWFAIGYGKELRKKLLNKITRIANCNLVNVFEAGNSPVVTFYKKNNSRPQIEVDKFDNQYKIILRSKIESNIISANFGIVFANHLPLIAKIKSLKTKVSDFYKAENPCSVSEAYEIKKIIEDSSHSDNIEGNYFRFVNTGTIDPWVSLWGIKDTTYLKSKYKRPVIHKGRFKKLLPRRYNQMSQEKIIISGMRHFESFLDLDGVYIAGKSTEILLPKNGANLKLALLIFNSKLIRFYIKENYSVLGIDGGINFTPDLISNLPFPDISKISTDNLINFSDEILKEVDKTKRDQILNDINELVMDLYNLDSVEKNIIRNFP